MRHVSFYSSYTQRDGPPLLWLHSCAIARYSDLGEHLLAVYSGWKLLDNYDTYAIVFVVLFNGFMSLTIYFDVMYRY